jgi:membrane protease YdiL (CAAX protease family)
MDVPANGIPPPEERSPAEPVCGPPVPAVAVAEIPAPAPDQSLGWKDLLIGVGLIWGVELAANAAVAVALVVEGILRHGKPPSPDQLELGPLSVAVPTVVVAAWTLAVIWFLACRRGKRRFAEGFGFARVGPLVTALAVGVALLGASAGALLSSRFDNEDSLMVRLASTPGGLAAVCILAMVLPPVEELYYRGFLFPILRRYAGAAAAVAIVTLWFAAVHAIQLWGDWVSLACVASMGLAWTLMRQMSDSLLPSLVSHWLYNATLVFMSLAFPGAGN